MNSTNNYMKDDIKRIFRIHGFPDMGGMEKIINALTADKLEYGRMVAYQMASKPKQEMSKATLEELKRQRRAFVKYMVTLKYN